MSLVLIGVNHKSAPIEVRERLAIPDWRLEEATRKLLQTPGVEEAFILSTCNRVEMLVANSHDSAEGQRAAISAVHSFLRDYFEIDPTELTQHLYEFHHQEATRHVFRVAASLDSMIVGEPQILGQVKSSFTMARAVGALDSQLEELLSRALAVAKRVRTETAIGSSAVSVASVAVDLAKKIFGSLHGRSVYLVGAGKMSELAARHLLAHGAASIVVANRTHERAIGIADRFGGEAIRFEDLYHTADRADIVITSTGAPHAIFRREHGELFLQKRRNRPMFFIDIAVPRDVDPEMNRLDGIFVYDIDDLQQVVQSNLHDRTLEAGHAERMIEAEVARYIARVQGRLAVPAIVSLQQHVENIRRSELERMRGKLGKLTPEQEAGIEALTRAILNKVLHPSLVGLRRDSNSFAEMVKRVFGINAADGSSSIDEVPHAAEGEPARSISLGTKSRD
jgi:glutamyl-tRNA reductase